MNFEDFNDNEKNVFGFLYCLFVYCELTDSSPQEIIKIIGDRIKSFILMGWGDFNSYRDHMISDWNEMILNKENLNNFTKEIDKKCLIESESIFNKVKSIKANTDKKYSEIIREMFI